jgi:hypothetical protein
MGWMPPANDFLGLEEVVSLLQDKQFSIPVTLERLLTARDAFDGLSSRYKLESQRMLVHDVLKIPEPDDNQVPADLDYTAILKSGYAFFRCHCQRKLIRPTEYIKHHRNPFHFRLVGRTTGVNGISSDAISLIAKAILTCLGLSLSTPLSELLAMGPRFACLCKQNNATLIDNVDGLSNGMDFTSLVGFCLYPDMKRLYLSVKQNAAESRGRRK